MTVMLIESTHRDRCIDNKFIELLFQIYALTYARTISYNELSQIMKRELSDRVTLWPATFFFPSPSCVSVYRSIFYTQKDEGSAMFMKRGVYYWALLSSFKLPVKAVTSTKLIQCLYIYNNILYESPSNQASRFVSPTLAGRGMRVHEYHSYLLFSPSLVLKRHIVFTIASMAQNLLKYSRNDQLGRQS